MSRFQKTAGVGSDVTSHGTLFQRWLPSTGHAMPLCILTAIVIL